jgi:hypothetical protein
MSRPQTKNKSPFPFVYPSVPPEPTPHSFVLIRQAPKQRGCSFESAPSPARARQPTASFPFLAAGRAVRPRSLRRSPTWQPPASLAVVAHPFAPFPSTCLSGCRVVPFPPSPAASCAFAPCATHLRGSHLRCSLPHCSSVAHRHWARR